MPLGVEVGLGPGHIVFDGDPAPPPKRGTATPIFGPCIVAKRQNGWIQDATWYEVELSQGEIVLHGDPAPPIRGHISPHFSAHVYCGQMARWIKMPLGMEVGSTQATLC